MGAFRKTIWSGLTVTAVAVLCVWPFQFCDSETRMQDAGSQGLPGRILMKSRRAVFPFLIMLMMPSVLLAGPTIPGYYGSPVKPLPPVSANQLPALKPGGLLYGAAQPVTSGNQMTIYQNQSQAIIDWSSFNIGSNASVYFNQQGNTSWAVLNRIWDPNPSQIYGTPRADGKI